MSPAHNTASRTAGTPGAQGGGAARQEARALEALEQGRGQEEREAKSQSSRAARASGEICQSPEQAASGALILSRGLAERSVAHGSSEAEI